MEGRRFDSVGRHYKLAAVPIKFACWGTPPETKLPHCNAYRPQVLVEVLPTIQNNNFSAT